MKNYILVSLVYNKERELIELSNTLKNNIQWIEHIDYLYGLYNLIVLTKDIPVNVDIRDVLKKTIPNSIDDIKIMEIIKW